MRLNKLFRGLAGAVGATEAAAFSVCQPGTDREHLHLLTHVRGGPPVDDATREAAVVAFENIVRPYIAAGTDAAVEVKGSDRLLCLVRVTRDGTAAVVMAMTFIVRRNDREKAEATLRRLTNKMAARRLHNLPTQRTGAAGIVSFVRRLLQRGSGR